MNVRRMVLGALVVLGLGVASASGQGLGLAYPVAYDERGPVYYPTTVSYNSVTTARYTTSYGSNPAPYEAAPAVLEPDNTYRPAVPAYNDRPLVPVYAPPPATAFTYRPGAAAITYRPAVSSCAVPCCLFRPAPATYAPAPVAASAAYYPVRYATYNAAPAYAAPVVAEAGPKIIVRPKIVYVEGQPIRNFFRAITP